MQNEQKASVKWSTSSPSSSSTSTSSEVALPTYPRATPSTVAHIERLCYIFVQAARTRWYGSPIDECANRATLYRSIQSAVDFAESLPLFANLVESRIEQEIRFFASCRGDIHMNADIYQPLCIAMQQKCTYSRVEIVQVSDFSIPFPFIVDKKRYNAFFRLRSEGNKIGTNVPTVTAKIKLAQSNIEEADFCGNATVHLKCLYQRTAPVPALRLAHSLECTFEDTRIGLDTFYQWMFSKSHAHAPTTRTLHRTIYHDVKPRHGRPPEDWDLRQPSISVVVSQVMHPRFGTPHHTEIEVERVWTTSQFADNQSGGAMQTGIANRRYDGTDALQHNHLLAVLFDVNQALASVSM
jgi:hypothetical protein